MIIQYTPRDDLEKKLKQYLNNVTADGMTESEAMDLLVLVAIQTVMKSNRKPKKRRYG